ncbi:hypothetical protein KO465_02560 [Candidatus Micrarchaeota archaeon]|jgi:hypothetical protein|nr:hypothetical protein [Candidatus Micrarchaeota archaeon]
MNIDTAVKKILKKYEGKTIKAKEIAEIKDYVYKNTGEGKYAKTQTVKEWIKNAKKSMKEEKKSIKKQKTEQIVKKARTIRDEIYPKKSEQIPDQEEKKSVAIQNISYEMAAMRQILQRVNKQLDSIESMLKVLEE